MAKLVIDGFKNLDQAEEYASWFSGQGEQDAMLWMECNDMDYVTIDCANKDYYIVDGLTVTIKVR